MNVSRKPYIARFVLLLSIVFPTLVQASCEPSDVPGTWMTYGVNGDTFNGTMNETTRCKIKLNSSGSVVASSSSCKFRDKTGVHGLNVDKGKIEVSNNCVVTGFIRVCSGSNCVKQIIEHGTMSTEKNVISFVGYSNPNPDLVISFTGLKR